MEKTETKYVKHTQKDYIMSFKLSLVLVEEYETTKISLEALKRKYGIQGESTIRRWIENMVILMSRTNVTVIWKRASIINCWNYSRI